MGQISDGNPLFLEPKNGSNLHLNPQGKIQVASFWRKRIQSFQAFFTARHQTALQKKVKKIIANQSFSSSPKQQIFFEKMARLSHSKKSWLYQVLDVKDPVSLEISHQNVLSSPIQPFERGGRYYNQPGEKTGKQFAKTLYLLFPGIFGKVSEKDLHTWHRTPWDPIARSLEPKITWLGHATLLIQGENMNLLFDPTFSFVAPCFLRHTAPPIPFEELPLIDLVGISHNHADHFDRKNLKKLSAQEPFAFVPKGLDGWFKKQGFKNCVGARWWQQVTFQRENRTLKITAVPAWHGSQTTFSDIHRTLWMGFLIEMENLKIYIAGDSAYHEEILSEIKRHFGTIDIACLPIAPEGEKEMHMDAAQALDAFEYLGAKKMIPIHHGAYRMGREKIEDPISLFLSLAKKRNLSDQILNLQLGETCKVERAVSQFAYA